jgi:colicin import membrane protein
MAVTAKQVQVAWDQIVAQGGRPTVRAIRGALGGGSMGTLNKFVAQIRASNPLPAPTGSGPTVDLLLQTITKSFTQREEQVRQELTAELADMRGDLEAALGENDDLVEQARQANEQRVEAMTRAAHIEGEAAVIRPQMAALEGRCQAAEERAESAAVELADQRMAAVEAVTALQAAKARAESAEAHLAAASSDRDDAQRLLVEGLKAITDRYEDRLEKMRAAWEALTAEVRKANSSR